MNKIISYQAAGRICQQLKAANNTIIFKSGCFDIVHIGHIKLLEELKRIGGILIVGIGSDETVKKDRGGNTFFDENNRAETIASLSCVDYVIIQREESVGNIDHSNLLRIISPDYFSIATDDKSLEHKKMLANCVNALIIYKNPIKILNYGDWVEPHSSNFKK